MPRQQGEAFDKLALLTGIEHAEHLGDRLAIDGRRECRVGTNAADGHGSCFRMQAGARAHGGAAVETCGEDVSWRAGASTAGATHSLAGPAYARFEGAAETGRHPGLPDLAEPHGRNRPGHNPYLNDRV